jgi:hypothetical protein
MATKNTGNAAAALQRIQRLQKDGERLYQRVRKDAEGLLARGRKQLTADVREIQRRADRATRTLEASLLKRVHAASETQVKRLERRVAALEQRLATLESGTTARGVA